MLKNTFELQRLVQTWCNTICINHNTSACYNVKKTFLLYSPDVGNVSLNNNNIYSERYDVDQGLFGKSNHPTDLCWCQQRRNSSLRLSHKSEIRSAM